MANGWSGLPGSQRSDSQSDPHSLRCKNKEVHATCSHLMISDAEGQKMVLLARRAATEYLTKGAILKSDENDLPSGGVFVTLNRIVNQVEHLRGCIGFPVSNAGLQESVIRASIAAATEDPRFDPVQVQELDKIVFEVSVLTPPEEIVTKEPKERKDKIEIGRDGLIIRWRGFSGLLLPQVPKELGWDKAEFLRNICHKAGVDEDTWLDRSSKLFKFQADIFREQSPGGAVTRVLL